MKIHFFLNRYAALWHWVILRHEQQVIPVHVDTDEHAYDEILCACGRQWTL